METSKIVFARRNIEKDPVTKGELIVLLHELNNIDDDKKNISLTNNFVKELVRIAINSFDNKKDELDYEI